jgi:hypothetical protein
MEARPEPSWSPSVIAQPMFLRSVGRRGGRRGAVVGLCACAPNPSTARRMGGSAAIPVEQRDGSQRRTAWADNPCDGAAVARSRRGLNLFSAVPVREHRHCAPPALIYHAWVQLVCRLAIDFTAVYSARHDDAG